MVNNDPHGRIISDHGVDRPHLAVLNPYLE